mgnify:FL=1
MLKHLRINYLIIAFIFIVISALGIFCAFTISNRISMAAFMYGAGSETDPYRIYDGNQLYSLCEVSQSSNAKEWTKGKHFVLYNDVALTNYGALEGSTDGFYGILDGNGHTITIVQGALFYLLGQNASIKNANFRINVTGTAKKYNYGICRRISPGATIENCNVTGTIDLDCSMRPGGATSSTYIGGFCVFNGGKIINCSFDGQVIDSTDKFYHGSINFGIMAVNGGSIENCTVNADIDIYADAMLSEFGGIAYESKLTGCTFNGTYKITCSTASSMAGMVVRLYALSEECSNCIFNGNVIVDYQNRNWSRHSIRISSSESDYIHNGEIKILNKPNSGEE